MIAVLESLNTAQTRRLKAMLSSWPPWTVSQQFRKIAPAVPPTSDIRLLRPIQCPAAGREISGT